MPKRGLMRLASVPQLPRPRVAELLTGRTLDRRPNVGVQRRATCIVGVARFGVAEVGSETYRVGSAAEPFLPKDRRFDFGTFSALGASGAEQERAFESSVLVKDRRRLLLN